MISPNNTMATIDRRRLPDSTRARYAAPQLATVFEAIQALPDTNRPICPGLLNAAITAAGERRTPYFYRTEDGAEVDLLFERGGKPEMAIEIKRSSAPTLSRGFHLAREVLKVKESFLVHGGEGTWPESNGVTAIGLRELMRKLSA